MQTAANGNSNRQLDLLKKFGLKHHFFERIELDDIVTVLSLLDVEKIAPEIRTMREKSMAFLKEALQIGVEK